MSIEEKIGKEWEVVIGIEVHARIKTESKLFSSAPNSYGGNANEHVSLVDAGMPGSLPVLNKSCIDAGIKTGLALEARINSYSEFARKNYFYPDLPLGYQISQYDKPIVTGGHLHIESGGECETKKIRINHLHLEQDAGKSIHDQDTTKTLIDLNRAGTPLMEIVSEPDMRSIEEATLFVWELRQLLLYIDVCDGNMEEGSLRADVNISLNRHGEGLGTRTEIKNLNSLRFIRQALEYEIGRQHGLLSSGGKVEQETLLFDTKAIKTKSLRTKEDAHDYRYFPEPDLLPVIIKESEVECIRGQLPELPQQRRERFHSELGIPRASARELTSTKEIAGYFEEAIVGVTDNNIIRGISNRLITELFGYLNKSKLSISELKVGPSEIRELELLVGGGSISSASGKEVFKEMLESGKSAKIIVEERGLGQISDTQEIEKIVEDILSKNERQVEEYKRGKENLLGWFVGQVMRRSGGRANPPLVQRLVKEKLEK